MKLKPQFFNISVAFEDQGDMVPILGVTKKKSSFKKPLSCAPPNIAEIDSILSLSSEL